MKRSWIAWNRLYIQAVNSDDGEQLNYFFDEACDEDLAFFTRKRYIWNIIRGKEFCRILADWVVDWYRRASEDYERGDEIMEKVLCLLHNVMYTLNSWDNQDKIKRSLIWKITKYAPILTVDTLPYISEERLIHILDSDKWIVTDQAMKPVVEYNAKLKVDLATARASVDLMSDLAQ